MSCPGLFPLLFTAFWRRQFKIAVLVSTISGVVFGIATWLGLAYHYSGSVSITSTQGLEPCLQVFSFRISSQYTDLFSSTNSYGTMVSLFLPVPITIVISLLRPDDFSWESFGQLKIVEVETEETPGSSISEEEKSDSGAAQEGKPESSSTIAVREDRSAEAEQHLLDAKRSVCYFEVHGARTDTWLLLFVPLRLSKTAWAGFAFSVFLFWGVVPWPLYGSGYVFSLYVTPPPPPNPPLFHRADTGVGDLADFLRAGSPSESLGGSFLYSSSCFSPSLKVVTVFESSTVGFSTGPGQPDGQLDCNYTIQRLCSVPEFETRFPARMTH